MHPLAEMARARIHDILAGREDRNDHDTPRADPVFRLAADRSPGKNNLARLIRVPAHPLADETGSAIPTWTLRASVRHP
jgi:hypothetical protein